MDVKEVPHDSNLTMNIILKTLLENKDRLERVLFLQLDNCYRENKNKFLLSLASLLVEEKVFEEVRYFILLLSPSWKSKRGYCGSESLCVYGPVWLDFRFSGPITTKLGPKMQ